jgi:benzoyl-CoA reductase/2-hydroxyglutaryl-CoA dehydratase subunit BcrC/BadD/HgdB
MTNGKVYVMEIPNIKSGEGKALWLSEVKKFSAKLEQISGKKITLDKLKEGSRIVNEKRKALQRLATLRSADPSPISGLDALLVNQIAFYDDPIRFTTKVNELCDELTERVKTGQGVSVEGSPRILISGSPMAIPNWKIHAIVEGSGATIVGEESCVGERNFASLLDERFTSVEQGIQNIASRYLTINCACFTPNDERLTDIEAIAKRVKADGILHYAIQFCTPYMIEATKVKKFADKIKMPFLRIETDYSMEDMGQLKTRIEAFLEMMGKGVRV